MSKLKSFLIEHELKLVLVTGFVLVALISFQFGRIEGKKGQNKAIVIEKVVEVAKIDPEGTPIVAGVSTPGSTQNPTEAKILAPNCTYVGSKSSNKVHLPTCRYAKSIKPENLVCFKSLDDAVKQGRVADKNCIK
ncbi:MAG: hypothetical protein WAV73_01140 [Candidatus Moraniibacteriota bacterium]